MIVEITSIKRLRNIITKDVSTIPIWIEPTSSRHQHIFKAIQNIFILLSKLTDEKILSDLKISRIMVAIDQQLDMIIDLGDDLINVMTQNHLLSRIEFYLRFCVDTELFECAANFKTFIEMYG